MPRTAEALRRLNSPGFPARGRGTAYHGGSGGDHFLRRRRHMRLRTAKDRLKVEHSIIDGLRPVLESLLAATPEIQTIIPGVIRPVRDARGPVKIRITTPTQTGWKAIALAAGARQELFVTTKISREALDQAIQKALKG
jgi:hypothetical protein